MPRFVIAALVAGLSVPFAPAEEPKPEGPAKVETQAEAIQEAKDVSLKPLEKADRVVLVPRGPKAGESVTVKGDDVAALRKALVPKAVSPSGGQTAVALRFYQGEKLLRTVWMFSYGEWGFERPGLHWTLGDSDDLPGLVRKHFKK